MAWLTLVGPWVSLYFMKRQDRKRYMPVALFGVILVAVLQTAGLNTGLGAEATPAGPPGSVPPFLFGFLPVVTLWVFRFAYGRFWTYLAAYTALAAGIGMLARLYATAAGTALDGMAGFEAWASALILAAVLYAYQMWQEEVLIPPERSFFSPNLQPAAAKLLSEERKNDEDDE